MISISAIASLNVRLHSAVLSVFVVITSCSYAVGAVPLDEVTSAYRDATMFLVVKGVDSNGDEIVEKGTGFFISSSGYLLTNFHLLADSDERPYRSLKIRGKKGGVYDPDDPTGVIIEIELIRYDAVQDVALLKAKEIDGPHNFVRACRETQVRTGESIYILGYDLGLGLKPTQGTLGEKDATRGYWQFTALTDLGGSGGPIFNSGGRLIGINQGGLEGSNIQFMIPIQHVFDYFSAASTSLDYCKTLDGNETSASCAPIAHVYEVELAQKEHEQIGTSTRLVARDFEAKDGYRIVTWNWISASSANATEVLLTPMNEGRTLRLSVGLSSGPFFDRWSGWVSGQIVTRQEKIECVRN